MDNAQLNQQLKVLRSKCDDVTHEKKLLTTDFDGLKDFVIKVGITSALCLVLRITLLQIFLDSKSASVKALGRFLAPFDYAVFIVAFILFSIRGFDLFINADTKYSKIVAKKLDKATVSDKMNELNSEIMRLQLEINKTETTLYEQGGKPDVIRDNTLDTITIQDNFFSQNDMEQNGIFMEEGENLFAKQNQKNSIDDILNGLDDFSVDDEDEFENSSDLWEKDAMKHYK